VAARRAQRAVAIVWLGALGAATPHKRAPVQALDRVAANVVAARTPQPAIGSELELKLDEAVLPPPLCIVAAPRAARVRVRGRSRERRVGRRLVVDVVAAAAANVPQRRLRRRQAASAATVLDQTRPRVRSKEDVEANRQSGDGDQRGEERPA